MNLNQFGRQNNTFVFDSLFFTAHIIEFLQCCSEAVVQIWKVAECRENRNESSLEEMKNALNSYYLIIELQSSTYSNQLNLYYSRTL